MLHQHDIILGNYSNDKCIGQFPERFKKNLNNRKFNN